MDVAGVRVLVAPDASAAALVAVTVGVLLGTCSGLVPGLHVNSLALLLAAVAPPFRGRHACRGCHALDVVPTLAPGVPGPTMAVSALPSHRLVMGSRGRETLRISALGSGVAVAFVLGIPVTAAATVVAPLVYAHLPVVVTALVVVLLVREPTQRARVGGCLAVAASGALGVVALPMQPDGLAPTGDVLAPLFAGLFGAPVLLEAYRGVGIHERVT